jgi:hypothetical protein
MTPRLTGRFWLELIAFGASATLALLTLVWDNWIELTLGVDPDGGSGALEAVVVLLALGGVAVASRAVRREWLRAVRVPS